MKGSIIERNGSYRIRIATGKDAATGKYTNYFETINVSGLNKREAKNKADQRLRELLTEIDKGTFIRPGKDTLSEYLKVWLADYVKPNLAARTHELYSYVCHKHIIPTIGHCPLADLKPQHIQHLYAEKRKSGLSSRTVQLIHITLHKSLKNAVKIGLLARNVVEAVDVPKIQRHEIKIMDEADINRFLESVESTEYYTLFYTFLFTGCRRGELLAVRWCDFDPILCQLSITRSMQYLNEVKEPSKRIIFKAPKTQKSRRLIDLSPSTVAVLQEHREAENKRRESLDLPNVTADDLIFCHLDGKPLLPQSITHAWMKLTRRCGINGVRLHDSRHSHASLMLKQGIPVKVIAERLGHAGTTITQDLYVHVTPGMQKAAALKFDEAVLPKRI